MISYTNYTNLDAMFDRTYEPGDRVVRGWQGEIDDSNVSFANALLELAELIYAKHNRDDRPDGKLCPSMSVGDVIVIGEIAMSVDRMGFVVVQLEAADLINDHTWLEMVK